MTEIDLEAVEALLSKYAQAAVVAYGEDTKSACDAEEDAAEKVLAPYRELIAEVRKLREQLAEAKGRECTALCRDVEEDRDSLLPVVEAARAWRRWFPHADSMFAPENALIGVVDAFEAEN